MLKELGDFCFELSEFNDCTFCKKFGLIKNCPVKPIYENYGEDNPPPPLKIQIGYDTCKKYVLMNLDLLMALNG